MTRDLHGEVVFGEWSVLSSSRKAILMVKQGLSSWKIEVIFVGPQPRIVVKSSLNIEKDGFMIKHQKL